MENENMAWSKIMTYTIKAYAGTFPYKNDLKSLGFEWVSDPQEGQMWIKHGATEDMVLEYRANIGQGGKWQGLCFTVAKEKDTITTPTIKPDFNESAERAAEELF
jgi:hypothetical protein